MKKSLLTVLVTATTIAAGRAPESTLLNASFAMARESYRGCTLDHLDRT